MWETVARLWPELGSQAPPSLRRGHEGPCAPASAGRREEGVRQPSTSVLVYF